MPHSVRHDPLWITAQRKNPAAAFGVWRGFFFVDKRLEISNLELIRDIGPILKFCEFIIASESTDSPKKIIRNDLFYLICNLDLST
jgi:hypothetical protein